MRYSQTRSIRTAWSMVILSALWVLAAVGLYYLNQSQGFVPMEHRPSALNLVMALTFSPVGLLILRARPRHPIGWIFLAIGFGQALSQFSLQYAFYTMQIHPGALPFARLAFWLQDFVWFPSFSLFIILLAVFPTGQPMPGRWKWLIRLVVISILLYLASTIIKPLIDPQSVSFAPLPTDNYTFADTFFDLSVLSMMASVTWAIIAVFQRLKRSEGVERQQMKWFTFSGLVFGFVFLVLSALSVWPVLYNTINQDPAFRFALGAAKVLFPTSVALIPLAVSIAILRHKLYGIDLIIRRTLIYTVLTVLFAVIYLAALVSMQALFTWLTRQARSELAIVLSTLVIAVLFAPMRARIQGSIDRRFYRSRYDAEKALASFSSDLRKEVDLQPILDRTLRIVEETIQPTNITILLFPTRDQEP